MSEPDALLVTGGAGFIGSNFVHAVREREPDRRVVVLDKLTYAGNAENLDGLGVEFVRGDVAEPEDVRRAFDAAGADGEKSIAVVHFAAETHVDRSIESGLPFLRTNVVGTQVLLDVARGRGASQRTRCTAPCPRACSRRRTRRSTRRTRTRRARRRASTSCAPP